MFNKEALLITVLAYIPIIGKLLAIVVWPATAYTVRAIYRKVMDSKGDLAWFPLATLPMLCNLVNEKYVVAYLVTLVATVLALGTSITYLFLFLYIAHLSVLALVYSKLFKQGWKTTLLVILPVLLPLFLYREFLKEEK